MVGRYSYEAGFVTTCMDSARSLTQLAEHAVNWYDLEVATLNTSHFDGLHHPIHQQVAVVTWKILK